MPAQDEGAAHGTTTHTRKKQTRWATAISAGTSRNLDSADACRSSAVAGAPASSSEQRPYATEDSAIAAPGRAAAAAAVLMDNQVLGSDPAAIISGQCGGTSRGQGTGLSDAAVCDAAVQLAPASVEESLCPCTMLKHEVLHLSVLCVGLGTAPLIPASAECLSLWA